MSILGLDDLHLDAANLWVPLAPNKACHSFPESSYLHDEGHVPKEERLLYAVAVVLQSQSFSLRGMDLEKHLEILLDVNGSNALAQDTKCQGRSFGVLGVVLNSSWS